YFPRFVRSVSVVSQSATLPVAFSANDDADNCRNLPSEDLKERDSRYRRSARPARSADHLSLSQQGHSLAGRRGICFRADRVEGVIVDPVLTNLHLRRKPMLRNTKLA